jgi:hypothetical protein
MKHKSKSKPKRTINPTAKKGGDNNNVGFINEIYDYLNNTSTVFDNSKLFAGFMLLIMNISTKYVKIKLSPSVESFLKNSFGMELLIFIILWVGTKNLLISIIITGIFIIIFDYLLNEESQFSILPETFTQYYNNLNNDTNTHITDEDIIKAKKILEKVRD